MANVGSNYTFSAVILICSTFKNDKTIIHKRMQIYWKKGN